MRFAPFIALLAGFSILAATAYEADAQSRRDQRPRVYIKKHRNYLDAGTEVTPGSKNYHSHIYTREALFPTYSADPTGQSRWPLPMQFELPYFR